MSMNQKTIRLFVVRLEGHKGHPMLSINGVSTFNCRDTAKQFRDMFNETGGEQAFVSAGPDHYKYRPHAYSSEVVPVEDLALIEALE